MRCAHTGLGTEGLARAYPGRERGRVSRRDWEQQRRICVDLQKQPWEDAPFIPTDDIGRQTPADIVPGCQAERTGEGQYSTFPWSKRRAGGARRHLLAAHRRCRPAGDETSGSSLSRRKPGPISPPLLPPSRGPRLAPGKRAICPPPRVAFFLLGRTSSVEDDPCRASLRIPSARTE